MKSESLRWRETSEQSSGPSQWMRRRQWLLAQLKAAPKPMGVFAANGMLAVEIQELCGDAGIGVPSEVAIVGIEDYLLSVGAANRSISGVDTNLEEHVVCLKTPVVLHVCRAWLYEGMKHLKIRTMRNSAGNEVPTLVRLFDPERDTMLVSTDWQDCAWLAISSR